MNQAWMLQNLFGENGLAHFAKPFMQNPAPNRDVAMWDATATKDCCSNSCWSYSSLLSPMGRPWVPLSCSKGPGWRAAAVRGARQVATCHSPTNSLAMAVPCIIVLPHHWPREETPAQWQLQGCPLAAAPLQWASLCNPHGGLKIRIHVWGGKRCTTHQRRQVSCDPRRTSSWSWNMCRTQKKENHTHHPSSLATTLALKHAATRERSLFLNSKTQADNSLTIHQRWEDFSKTTTIANARHATMWSRCFRRPWRNSKKWRKNTRNERRRSSVHRGAKSSDWGRGSSCTAWRHGIRTNPRSNNRTGWRIFFRPSQPFIPARTAPKTSRWASKNLRQKPNLEPTSVFGFATNTIKSTKNSANHSLTATWRI